MLYHSALVSSALPPATCLCPTRPSPRRCPTPAINSRMYRPSVPQLYRQGTFDEPLARLYTAEIVLGITHLHSLGFVHRWVGAALALALLVLAPVGR
jgi:hypothetical protein